MSNINCTSLQAAVSELGDKIQETRRADEILVMGPYNK